MKPHLRIRRSWGYWRVHMRDGFGEHLVSRPYLRFEDAIAYARRFVRVQRAKAMLLK